MKTPQRASPTHLVAYRLERNAEILSPEERPTYWAGVLAGLKAVNVLGNGHTSDLLEFVKRKVAS